MLNVIWQVEWVELGYYFFNVLVQYFGNIFFGIIFFKIEFFQGICVCLINVRVNLDGKDYCVCNKEVGEGKRVVGCQKSLYIEIGKNWVFFIVFFVLNL